LPRVFRLDHEVLAAVAISDAVLFEKVPELRNPETYGRFAAYIEEVFPAGREEKLSDGEVTRGREVLEELSRRRATWDFGDDQRP
jgi:hypothetical protein